MNLSDIAILNIKDSDYCCIISLISKNEAINLLQNAGLTEKSATLWIKTILFFLLKKCESICESIYIYIYIYI